MHSVCLDIAPIYLIFYTRCIILMARSSFKTVQIGIQSWTQ